MLLDLRRQRTLTDGCSSTPGRACVRAPVGLCEFLCCEKQNTDKKKAAQGLVSFHSKVKWMDVIEPKWICSSSSLGGEWKYLAFFFFFFYKINFIEGLGGLFFRLKGLGAWMGRFSYRILLNGRVQSTHLRTQIRGKFTWNLISLSRFCVSSVTCCVLKLKREHQTALCVLLSPQSAFLPFLCTVSS